ncbi:hypothetical protein ACFO25_10635 [Paenactinomyces guangxiensis]|uniref:Lia operon protein LiaI n=1 Tax=Paenactinomyces guangxiensis TaxID=1490290 RepID=A0A7W2A750_9BACL|nr:hypothetical protein [Paenactinomyces guangxiensis]MBA4494146.1 hypothetical protein [Paenactinomyces guangxiensis]MBH8591109.1 hypothetical protein [Paenactinomyces guangxiensis]
MKNGKKLAGVLLLIVGAGIFLGDFGGVIAFLIVAGLTYYGVKKLKASKTQGQKVFAVIVLGIAALMLLHLLPLMLGILIGGACLYYGWKLFKKDGDSEGWAMESGPAGDGAMTVNSPAKVDTSFEADWQEFLKRQNKNG